MAEALLDPGDNSLLPTPTKSNSEYSIQTVFSPVAVLGVPSRALRTLVVLSLIDFLIFCSYPLLSPFLPGVLKAKGVSDELIGVVFSAMTACMFVLSPFVSLLSRRFSRKVQYIFS